MGEYFPLMPDLRNRNNSLLYDFHVTIDIGKNDRLYRHGQYGEILPSN